MYGNHSALSDCITIRRSRRTKYLFGQRKDGIRELRSKVSDDYHKGAWQRLFSRRRRSFRISKKSHSFNETIEVHEIEIIEALSDVLSELDTMHIPSILSMKMRGDRYLPPNYRKLAIHVFGCKPHLSLMVSRDHLDLFRQGRHKWELSLADTIRPG